MKFQKTLSRILDGLILLVFILFFSSAGFQDKFTGNWSYQEVPQLTNSIVDIKFLDSLTGFLTSFTYLYKTTNGGYNWSLIYSPNKQLHPIQFINNTTGFLGGATILYKTTNRGDNWFEIPKPLSIGINDLYALNEDTIWIADQENLDGGVFRTTNGGENWQLQWAGGASNPSRIYMFNKDFGFQTSATSPDSWLLRTTNSGVNWNTVSGGSFTDIIFFDTLIGYKGFYDIKKTTDGGLSWNILSLPIQPFYTVKFSFINNDTLWAVGGYVLMGSNFRGILYNSTNGGNTWRYQIPDTSYNIPGFRFIQFINKNIGWAYRHNNGIHTITGGDTTFIVTSINNNEISQLPEDYLLYQNYPNPFNPFTTIKFSLKIKSNVSLDIFDMKGGRIKTIIDSKLLSSGTYEYGFDGSNYSSGVYFYRLKINNKSAQTNKMVLTK